MASTKQLFFANLAQTTDFPLALEMEKAEGCTIWDVNGKPYIDLISGISVSNIGHRHPDVVDAIIKQVNKHMHLLVYGEFIQSPQAELAHALTEALGYDLDNVFLVNSGSEAIEGAMKLAKRFTGKRKLVAFNKAYHGSTQGALSIIGDEEFRRGYRPLLPGIVHLEFNDVNEFDHIDSNTAAVIVETVQGEAGYIPPHPGYLAALREKCDEVGALLIFDEIQAGFGRTGSLFAFQRENVRPDIVTLAKGMGGGMPIGAFVSRKEIMDALKENPILGHITTFGGHPVSSAAALASLKVIRDGELWKNALEGEKRFRKLLVHDLIREVRGMGYMLAIQLDTFERVQKVIEYCLEKGVITDWFLFNETALRIAPPLTLSNEEIDRSCKIILEGIEKTRN
ncbi:aspartate aminotransferase family protein [Phaeocystidibacter marisrubri]|uniref:Aspartate aminotransferase family protein n=1 Tax=Phaeocystidibacter marisrubri TaxID=1577780 RepID=A0A6L3ZHH2_9FLAO|nr:aspartate aminotransferase family protein [Phaeocystidibacter marisrubri]KAB2817304.1 aspartate aminotransferase family protein [Phaeocystidibacter marisrubri]GGH76021.1 aspartate aminotransferase family protein [Phaeocystidibacter marisrubri]